MRSFMAQLSFLLTAFLFFVRRPYLLLAFRLQLVAFCLFLPCLGGSPSSSPPSTSLSLVSVTTELLGWWSRRLASCSGVAASCAGKLGLGVRHLGLQSKRRRVRSFRPCTKISSQMTLCRFLARSFTRRVARSVSHSAFVRWFVKTHGFFCPGMMILSSSGSTCVTGPAWMWEPWVVLLSGRLRLMYASCCSESLWVKVGSNPHRRMCWRHLRRDDVSGCPKILVLVPSAYHQRTIC